MKITKLIPTILFAAAMSVACAHASAAAMVFETPEAIRLSEKYTSQNDIEAAIGALDLPLLFASTDEKVEIYTRKALLEMIRGDRAAAIENADYLVRLAGEDSCARVPRAVFYETIGEPGIARADIEEARRAGCTSPQLMLMLADACIQREDHINALLLLNNVPDAAPYRYDRLSRLAFAHYLSGNVAAAAESFREALKHAPGSSAAFSMLADMYSSLGDTGQAEEYYKRALDADPSNAEALNNQAYNIFLSGDTARAIEMFDNINKTNPSPYTLCSRMEIALYQRDIEKAATIASSCMMAFIRDDRLRVSEKFYINAIQYIFKTAHSDRLALHPQTQLDLAAQYDASGDYVTALNAYFTAIILAPDNPQGFLGTGRMYLILGDRGKALMFLTEAAKKAGKDSPAAATAAKLIAREYTAENSSAWVAPADLK